MKKINWGTGIVITFVLFIGFILFFVVKTMTNSKYEYDLVATDYYKDELNYQTNINQIQNAKDKGYQIDLTIQESGMIVDFPFVMNDSDIKGEILLYRPSNKNLDKKLPIQLSEKKQFISNKILLPGIWNVKISWQQHGEKFLFEQSITK